MSTSLREATAFLVGLLPPGIDKLYDLTPGGDFFNLFEATASSLLTYGFNLLDKLRTEQFPSSIVDKLPDWEKFLGISRFYIARFGTIAQRQSAVVSKIRERGPFIDVVVQSVLAPLLGFAPTTPIAIIRTNRVELRRENTYTPSPDGVTVAAAAAVTIKFATHDGGKVSRGGLRLILEFSPPGPVSGTITVTGPDGATQAWTFTDADTSDLVCFFGRDRFIGREIAGTWTIAIANTGGIDLAVIPSLFVEGIARGQRTAGAAWEWGVYVDAAHLGEVGYSDFEAAAAAIARTKHSHTVGRLVLSTRPFPGVQSGINAAIPGRCTPAAV